MASPPFAGVLVPVLTPFTPRGEPDAGRFVYRPWKAATSGIAG